MSSKLSALTGITPPLITTDLLYVAHDAGGGTFAQRKAAVSVVDSRYGQVAFNAQTGTTYTLVLADGVPGTNAVSMSNASAQTLTVPLNASVAFPVGTAVTVQRLGAGVTTITPAGGVTFVPTGDVTINAQYAAVVLLKTATDTWKVLGASSISSADIVGSATNDDAVTGNLGEYISSYIPVGSAITLTTNTAANVTSINLGAGDWEVVASVHFSAAAATVTAMQAGTNSVSATLPTDGSEAYSGLQLTLGTAIDSVSTGRKRFKLSAPATIYIVAKGTFSAGGMTAFGGLTARKPR